MTKAVTMSNMNPPGSNQPKSRATGLNTAQRYTVRVVLLAGAMIAALIGAQAMAVIDKSVITATPTLPAVVTAVRPTVRPTFTVTPVKK
jgi:hypothetical protein